MDISEDEGNEASGVDENTKQSDEGTNNHYDADVAKGVDLFGADFDAIFDEEYGTEDDTSLGNQVGQDEGYANYDESADDIHFKDTGKKKKKKKKKNDVGTQRENKVNIEDHETKTKSMLIKELLGVIGKIKVYNDQKE